ncbi:DASH complex subunit Duo1 [Aspergillus parasiticus SU-1]|uniref:DASH complex subunit DUO1 n=1 Tax=Aspergillus parasiticus (strain ATCC 56775 / NRRL 5862 / SRRC 143 / SU-1) TaxID=1403190 RepID=A0A0F0IGD3_ASPPU|nr:DASH complex subunit Duo1 [Aspergillus parasiticus SU-1]
MAFRSTAEEMERLQLSDEDTDDLWDSPSKRGTRKVNRIPVKEESTTPPPISSHDGETLFDRQEARETALRNELQTVRNINQVIESLLSSLDRAKGNMDTVSRTVDSASTLLNTWTRILSQTEHNQRLILNPNWQGAVQDVADLENEERLKQQAAERRERELQEQREAAARRAAEEEKRRTQAAARGTRGRDESPEVERAMSPALGDANRVKSPVIRSPVGSPPVPGLASNALPSPSHFAGSGQPGATGFGNSGYGGDVESGRWNMGAFDTSLPIRMDFEAMLAYLLLPPAGGVFLLLVEHKSDYVRFHAWQSSMLFTVMFILHLIFAWSSFFSWTLFLCDLAMIGFLSMRAYRDVDTLDHYEVPIFGRLANSFVDDE